MGERGIIMRNWDSLYFDKDLISQFIEKAKKKNILEPNKITEIERATCDEKKLRIILLHVASYEEEPGMIEGLSECFSELELYKQAKLLRSVSQVKPNIKPIIVKTSAREMGDASKVGNIEPSEVYKMRSDPRGYARIINIMEFDTKPDLTRDGSDVDVTNLSSLWSGLGFQVKACSNLTKQDFVQEIEQFRSMEEHREADAVVLFIMTHGFKVSHNAYKIDLLCKDGGTVCSEWIISQFSDEKCPLLKGKPKLIFFQACRGEANDYGVARSTRRDSGINLYSRTTGDIIVVYPCVPGRVSLRDNDAGAWMVQEMCEIFKNCACEHHLEDMLKMVISKLKKKRDYKEGMEVLAYENRSFLKELYFNPGIKISS